MSLAVLVLRLPVDLLARAGGALGIITGGLALYWLLNRLLIYRAQKNGGENSDGLPFALDGKAVILYFTTPECAPCRTIQRPALARVQQRLGDRLQVVEVDAQERPDLASRWGVLSVPTTFIIDGQGQVRQVNHGATRADKLEKQLEPILTAHSDGALKVH
ncbi:MAG TPA: thioredoxin family protein [Anaerolineaceae bacterium]